MVHPSTFWLLDSAQNEPFACCTIIKIIGWDGCCMIETVAWQTLKFTALYSIILRNNKSFFCTSNLLIQQYLYVSTITYIRYKTCISSLTTFTRLFFESIKQKGMFSAKQVSFRQACWWATSSCHPSQRGGLGNRRRSRRLTGSKEARISSWIQCESSSRREKKGYRSR